MDDDTNLQEAILEHAKESLGLDTDKDADLFYLAKECLLAAPPGEFLIFSKQTESIIIF